MTKKDKNRRKLSATYGKNGLPELPAVPMLLIVVGPAVEEPGEQPNPTRNRCQCGRCQYVARHTGNA